MELLTNKQTKNKQTNKNKQQYNTTYNGTPNKQTNNRTPNKQTNNKQQQKTIYSGAPKCGHPEIRTSCLIRTLLCPNANRSMVLFHH